MNMINQETGEVTSFNLQSGEVNELAKALSKAQGAMTAAKMDGQNPHFKSSYATLDNIWQAIRKPLSESGLSVVQALLPDNVLVTTLMHESGQWMRSYLKLNPVNNTPQGVGAALTYGRRYSLAAMVGIAQADDDGEVANQPKTKPEATRQAQRPPAPPATNGGTQPTKADTPTNGDIPRKPQDLLDSINRKVQVPYDNLFHLQNAIKQELGDDWKWPKKPDDSAGWKAAYDAAYNHAVAKTKPVPEEATEVEPTGQAEMFDGEELDEWAGRMAGGAAYQD